jgi:ferric-dicitrate binding protein FerR (iron transport regulator)
MIYNEFPEEISLELLTKYFAGECTGGDKELIHSWILADKKNERLIFSLKKLWDVAGFENVNIDTNAAWENVCEKIDSDFEIKHKISFPFVKTITFLPVLQRIAAVAAVLLIIIGGYVSLQKTGIFSKQKNLITVWNERKTLAGEKSVINFSDGTKITLNGNSKLRYSNNASYKNREVYLEGEAFFEVARDTSKPFIVHCKNISTTVLGTKFNISAYSTEKEIAISLVEGKVNVSENKMNYDNKLATLQPNQQFLYSTSKETYNIKEFDIDKIIGWKDNLLKFKDETLENVFIHLERAYGVKFELEPKHFKNYLITASFQNASLLTILEVIKKLTGLDYNALKENDQVEKIIYFKK